MWVVWRDNTTEAEWGGWMDGRGQGGESLEQEVTRLAQKIIYRDEWFQIPWWKQEKIKSKRKELKAQKENESNLTSRISEIESFLTRAT